MTTPQNTVLDQSGRPLGKRALQTRRRLLDATARLLSKRRVREIRVVEIAREIGASPATFYQYFKDVDEAVLELANEARESLSRVLQLIDAQGGAAVGLDNARRLARAFVEHQDQYGPVLMVRDLLADEGDPRFRAIREETMAPIMRGLAGTFLRAQQAGRVPRGINVIGAGAAMTVMLLRLPAYGWALEPHGLPRDDLIESLACLVYLIINGTPPPDR